ncbi:glycerol-3-phosphate dehydrogenase [Lentilitoribacter sp. EG35]|uniref:glycerol-3-phosphate dehydrogenase n=1 Tax=Lentilitoribacter sp. EG35 TaxID=3234192 RepID=UPI00345F1A71
MSNSADHENEVYDVFVIGGGINGCGIARDAAGRGYRVALAEMNDFASATSSASTKLFHGGLRYLEYFKFRLVREALIEREVLLSAMPHISWPKRFVLPVYPEMRFENSTPTSKLLSTFMPWMKGSRPKWLIRFGLFLYDHLGGRKILPATSSIDLTSSVEGEPLLDKYKNAYEYSDCWVEDSRLTLLNAIDAQNRGATILDRTKVVSAKQEDGIWEIHTLDANDNAAVHYAKMIVNAGGPWVGNIIQDTVRLKTNEGVRLVRGSHIITKKLYDHDKCYFFQGEDGRIMFAIPYEEDYTLIGTTDAEHLDPSIKPECSDEEADYMISFVNNYFKKNLTRDDVVWSYSGVRPLYDDGASSASAATRDYVLKINDTAGAPVLNVFGGKITTYRKLAESSLEKIDDVLDKQTAPWTAGVSLPGGDFPVDQVANLQNELAGQLPFLNGFTIRRLIRQYGTQTANIFGEVSSIEDMGVDFGHGIYSREIDWAIKNEWVHNAQDFLWRRSKMGLRFDTGKHEKLEKYITQKLS